jgi:hypothetical protein
VTPSPPPLKCGATRRNPTPSALPGAVVVAPLDPGPTPVPRRTPQASIETQTARSRTVRPEDAAPGRTHGHKMGPDLANSATETPVLGLRVPDPVTQAASPAPPDGTTGPGKTNGPDTTIGPGGMTGPDTTIGPVSVAVASETIGPGGMSDPGATNGPDGMTGAEEEAGLATADRPGRRLERAHRW